MQFLPHFVAVCLALQITYSAVSVEAKAIDAFKDAALKITHSVADQADKTPEGMLCDAE